MKTEKEIWKDIAKQEERIRELRTEIGRHEKVIAGMKKTAWQISGRPSSECPCKGSGKIHNGGFSVTYCDVHEMSPFD